jgi:hypothetical protein
MMTEFVIDLAGWIGAAAIVLAYALISAGRVTAKQPAYQALNLFGSLAVVVNSTWYRAYPSTFINVVWIGIAVAALIAIRRARG